MSSIKFNQYYSTTDHYFSSEYFYIPVTGMTRNCFSVFATIPALTSDLAFRIEAEVSTETLYITSSCLEIIRPHKVMKVLFNNNEVSLSGTTGFELLHSYTVSNISAGYLLKVSATFQSFLSGS